MRVLPNEIDFAKYLLDVGNGALNDHDNNIKLPQQCILPPNKCIVQNIFGNLIEEKKFDEISHCAILSARNADVDEINNRVTNLLDKSTEHIYTGIDSTENCDNGHMEEVLLPKYLNTMNPPNFPPHRLRLRKFCIVMLIRNISLDEGLCNGTKLQVLDFSNHLLKCKILTSDKRNNIVFLNRITLYCENQYPLTFKRRQFPIRLAFAITINKSQGQTFDKIGIDLRRDVFNHGQLYVAMSRVRL
ncbi:ATP-dependent DNA helicase PIF1-like [Phymastichus coffea]|uniref:ATP-dependent DNA helicase PIF1-like n=1 Tax=Phymastichus coffea TaxID=108790 RepID=UPI00273BD269|nr:ATP-dependent DNA helicase PIF1-like [Phymastichus coffea]